MKLFIIAGIGLILLALYVGSIPAIWKGILLIGGGWLMAIGGLYQVKLYADDKNVLYYVLIDCLRCRFLDLVKCFDRVLVCEPDRVNLFVMHQQPVKKSGSLLKTILIGLAIIFGLALLVGTLSVLFP